MNRATRKDLHGRCQDFYQRIVEGLSCLGDEGDRRDCAFALLQRLLFSYFLQQQGLLDDDPGYLQRKVEQCRSTGVPFALFLATLTTEGFGIPLEARPFFARQVLGTVPYLSGSLFFSRPTERQQAQRAAAALTALPNEVFEEALAAFSGFTWTLVEGEHAAVPEGVVTPAFLGTLAEFSVQNRKQTGSFYTPEAICSYIVRQTCEPVLMKRFEEITGRHSDSIEELIATLDARDCALLLFVILPTISGCDPACGAGDFLVVSLERMADAYTRVIERAASLRNPFLDGWLRSFDDAQPGRAFALKKRVACQNIFGVDIQQLPLDVARLRLSLNLLGSVKEVSARLALPNLDYSLPRGNALIGLDRITDSVRVRLARIHPGYSELVATKNALVRRYQVAAGNPAQLAALRADIDACRQVAYESLNQVLLEQLQEKGAKIEERGREGQQARTSRRKRGFTLEDIRALDPFHWAFDFDEVMNNFWWERLDGYEAQVSLVEGRLRVRFGPQLAPA
jgi:hypothetical protein